MNAIRSFICVRVLPSLNFRRRRIWIRRLTLNLDHFQDIKNKGKLEKKMVVRKTVNNFLLTAIYSKLMYGAN